ncbi:hypothetical protein CHS0354_004398 [Potamilus streckersoni]|uniref:Uncharacterized protein n=1 Tax=Potamilus streckersoni TaxID=2493646 RepID=A0AAE0W3Y7_9BIVA|nr:hypothetical protein CHS0354_004398 [Potamilus streckersoni]
MRLHRREDDRAKNNAVRLINNAVRKYYEQMYLQADDLDDYANHTTSAKGAIKRKLEALINGEKQPRNLRICSPDGKKQVMSVLEWKIKSWKEAGSVSVEMDNKILESGRIIKPSKEAGNVSVKMDNKIAERSRHCWHGNG